MVVPLALTMLSAISADAVEASPDTITVRCTDGQTRTIRLVGDETFNYYVSTEGEYVKPVGNPLGEWVLTTPPHKK